MESTLDRTYPFIGANKGHRFAVILIAFVPLILAGIGIYQLWGGVVGWQHIVLLAGMWAFAGLGITAGFHRWLTHGAFKASTPAKILLLTMGTTSLQGGPASWAATHQRHHASADTKEDPHTPLSGFFHAHVGWLFRGRLVHSGPAYDKLMQDPIVRFYEKTQLFWYVARFIIPGFLGMAMGIGFWSGLLWGGVICVFLGHHITWSINSVCHVWGTRPYNSPDQARNNVIFALLGFGEGWHNNHHAAPRSAWLGHRWYQVDPGLAFIAVLRVFGLVSDVRSPRGTVVAA